MEKIEISVIIPAYNVEKYIGYMLDCVLNQTFKNFELIIVNDCSNDKTLEVIQKYNDTRIKLINRTENSGGCYIPRADAIDIAIGKWVVCLDADDFIESTYLEELYERVTRYGVDICSPQMITVNDNIEPNGWIVPQNDFDFDRIYSNVEAFNLTVPKWKIGMGGAIIKKTVYELALKRYWKAGKRTARSDEILSRVLLLEAVNGYMASRTKYYYRNNPNSITSKFNLKYFEWIETNDDFLKFVESVFGKDSQEYRNVLVHDFYSYYSTFTLFAKQIDSQNIYDEGIKNLIRWHDRLEWSIIIKECSNIKEKARMIMCKSFGLSTKVIFWHCNRLEFLKKFN